uniref:Uncharacterized protein n=1 Tax=Aegilops tauschii subsp. strangulata TaxID=200361 RepID=A0A452YAR1_AEGTS
ALYISHRSPSWTLIHSHQILAHAHTFICNLHRYFDSDR